MSSFISAPSFRAHRATRRWVALGVSTLVALAACNSDDVTVPETAATVDVTPHLVSVKAGQTTQLAAQAKDANGNNIANDAVTWVSLDTNVATVNASGLVTVLQSGATAIVATTRGASGFSSIDAVGNVATVSITGTAQLPFAGNTQLNVVAYEANGRELFRPVTWTSSAPTVATVSSTGFVQTVGVGTATITATADGKSGTFTITVLPPPPVATVALSPNSGFVPTGIAVPLAITLRDASNNVLNDPRIVAWTTSNAAIATVSATGVVTAQTALGSVTITATSEGKSGTATFTTLTGLRSGVANPFANPSVNTSSFFAVYVPAGSTNLTVAMSGGTGDPDLYVYRPGLSLSGAATCASENNGPGETCTLATPAAGVWVVEVFAFTAHTGTNVTATVTPTPP